jgi:signal transduction histidine kinase
MSATAISNAPDAAGLESFVDGLVHDVRGSLGTMKAIARLARIRSESGDTDGASKLLARVDGAVTRTNELCNDLLECSRRRGCPAVDPAWFEVVDLAEVVRDGVADHAGLLHQAQCTLKLRAPHSASVRSHRKSVERVLANLLRNAVQYGAHRAIDICLEAGPRGHVLIVRDHGLGIPSEVLGRLFEGRAGDSRESDRCFERFGLGLWIVRTLVQSVGGRLHVASDVGQGTAVSVFIPVAPPVSAV